MFNTNQTYTFFAKPSRVSQFVTIQEAGLAETLVRLGRVHALRVGTAAMLSGLAYKTPNMFKSLRLFFFSFPTFVDHRFADQSGELTLIGTEVHKSRLAGAEKPGVRRDTNCITTAVVGAQFTVVFV